jgi:hypothetical protein
MGWTDWNPTDPLREARRFNICRPIGDRGQNLGSFGFWIASQ